MVYLLDNPIRHYAWGSVSAIPELLGMPATGEPHAELWLGGTKGRRRSPEPSPDGCRWTSWFAATR